MDILHEIVSHLESPYSRQYFQPTFWMDFPMNLDRQQINQTIHLDPTTKEDTFTLTIFHSFLKKNPFFKV